jgi:intracellular multiplication protein IcmC
VADFVSILTNLNESLSSVEKLISGGAYLFGMFMIFKGLYHLREFGNQRAMYSVSTSGYSSLIWLLVGLCLLYLPTALALFNNTVFGYDTPLGL